MKTIMRVARDRLVRGMARLDENEVRDRARLGHRTVVVGGDERHRHEDRMDREQC